jgi:RNA-directed DNA polymerase
MGWASPDDPALVDYWTTRRRRTSLPVDKTSRWLLKAQDGRCAICGSTFLPDDDRPQNPDEWETWLANARKDIAKVVTRQALKLDEHEPRLTHAHRRERSGTALLAAYEPTGLA